MHARSSFALGVAFALLVATFVPAQGRTQDAAPATRSRAELRETLTGTWLLNVSASAGQATIDGAIERAVSEMNFFLRGITRTQLREKTYLNRRIDIGFSANSSITVSFDQRFTYTTRAGVAQNFTLPDGAEIEVRQYFRGGNLEQYFGHSLGRRWNVYSLSDDGQTLTITATQQGPMMPVPVHFALPYRKQL